MKKIIYSLGGFVKNLIYGIIMILYFTFSPKSFKEMLDL